jgi:DNA repair protein RecO (recombination protein O)
MQTYRTDAIIIGRTDYGEADRILRILTPEQGKQAAIAKGTRRLKSRSGGHLELFGEVSLMLAPGRNLSVVASAQVKWYPHDLTGDYDRLGLAYMAATMIDRLIEENHPQPEIYDCLREALHALDSGVSGVYFELWFKLRLLRLLGYQPELRACAICGRSSAHTDYWFSADKGGIVDESCRSSIDQSISHSGIKLWRLLLEESYATIRSIANASELAVETISICDEFYRYHLGRAFSPSIASS